MSFKSWFISCINWKAIIVPFSKINCCNKKDGFYTGYSDYYIFGIRIARIQKTKPWDDV